MASENYILLERTELNASAASVTFASIPQTGYTDLKIVISARNSAGGTSEGIFLQMNSVATGYSNRVLFGNGSTAASGNNSYGITSKTYIGEIPTSGSTASTFGNIEVYIPNYTSSNQKSISSDAVTENNSTAVITALNASLVTSTAAITSLTFTPFSSDFAANSTFSLYGIAAVGTTPVIAPKASGGNIIDYDGTYWIHTFLTSGTFTPQVGLTCDYLVVAGGGSGGGDSTVNYAAGGGGGAGGLLLGAASINTSQTITIGAGGAGTVGAGTSGTNSTFFSLTAVGGGRGGSYDIKDGTSGGSGGGGAGRNVNETNTGGAGTSGQGNAGGNGYAVNGAQLSGGGGGGANATGVAATSTQAGNGGNGITSSITGTSVTYAGGGGGGAGFGSSGSSTAGTGGTGGGGSGYKTTSSGNFGNGSTGIVNTGGGGGGGSNSYTGSGTFSGGNGGSGIVIIRYPAV